MITLVYSKGCTQSSIFIEDENNTIHLFETFLDEDQKSMYHNNLDFIKRIIHKYTQSFSKDQLENFVSYYLPPEEDEEATPKTEEELRTIVSNFVEMYPTQNPDFYFTYFMIIQELIESLPDMNEESDWYRCETCGDSNYSHKALFSL